VDSAEADKVGSQGIRFCAYVTHSCDEGVRHYRTTPGAVNFRYRVFWMISVMAPF
jgi:hypothetical protein